MSRFIFFCITLTCLLFISLTSRAAFFNGDVMTSSGQPPLTLPFSQKHIEHELESHFRTKSLAYRQGGSNPPVRENLDSSKAWLIANSVYDYAISPTIEAGSWVNQLCNHLVMPMVAVKILQIILPPHIQRPKIHYAPSHAKQPPTTKTAGQTGRRDGRVHKNYDYKKRKPNNRQLKIKAPPEKPTPQTAIVTVLMYVEQEGDKLRSENGLMTLHELLPYWKCNSKAGSRHRKITQIFGKHFFRMVRVNLRLMQALPEFSMISQTVWTSLIKKDYKSALTYIQEKYPDLKSDIVMTSIILDHTPVGQKYEEQDEYIKKINALIRYHWLGLENMNECVLYTLLKGKVESFDPALENEVDETERLIDEIGRLTKSKNGQDYVCAMKHKFFSRTGYKECCDPMNESLESIELHIENGCHEEALSDADTYLKQNQHVLTTAMKAKIERLKIRALVALRLEERKSTKNASRFKESLSRYMELSNDRPFSSSFFIMHTFYDLNDYSNAVYYALKTLDNAPLDDVNDTYNEKIYRTIEIIAESIWHLSPELLAEYYLEFPELLPLIDRRMIFKAPQEASLFFYSMLIGYNLIIEIIPNDLFLYRAIGPGNSLLAKLRIDPTRRFSSLKEKYGFLIHMFRNLIRQGLFHDAIAMGNFLLSEENRQELEQSGFFNHTKGFNNFILKTLIVLTRMSFAIDDYKSCAEYAREIQQYNPGSLDNLILDICFNEPTIYNNYFRAKRHSQLLMRYAIASFDYLTIVYKLFHLTLEQPVSAQPVSAQQEVNSLLAGLWKAMQRILREHKGFNKALQMSGDLCALYSRYPDIFNSVADDPDCFNLVQCSPDYYYRRINRSSQESLMLDDLNKFQQMMFKQPL